MAAVERLTRLGHAVEVHAVLGERVGETYALAIDESAQSVWHEAAACA